MQITDPTSQRTTQKFCTVGTRQKKWSASSWSLLWQDVSQSFDRPFLPKVIHNSKPLMDGLCLFNFQEESILLEVSCPVCDINVAPCTDRSRHPLPTHPPATCLVSRQSWLFVSWTKPHSKNTVILETDRRLVIHVAVWQTWSHEKVSTKLPSIGNLCFVGRWEILHILISEKYNNLSNTLAVCLTGTEFSSLK